MSGMSAPSVLIMSTASGEREGGREIERRGGKLMRRNNINKKWLINTGELRQSDLCLYVCMRITAKLKPVNVFVVW